MVEARLFQALSDPTRLKILVLLAEGSANVSGMVKRLKSAQPAVSRHLRVLREAGLIGNVRRGKEVEYSANRETLARAVRYLQELSGGGGAAGPAVAARRTASRRATVKQVKPKRRPRKTGAKAKPASKPRPEAQEPGYDAPGEFEIERRDEPMEDFLL